MAMETDAEVAPSDPARRGFTIVRPTDGKPHSGRKQRDADKPGFALHPAIARGMALIRETSDSGGADVRTLFDAPGIHVSYAWFKSGFPLPLHSHDVDCYYQVIAGTMNVGTEALGKGDGVFIPAGVPYTVSPGERGVEFLEIRTSHDYDTHYRAKTDAYWDRIAETRRTRKAIWASEPPPYGLIDPAPKNP
ncbi:MAG: cupin domain-containing protein [Sphingobium sp.]